MSSKSHTKNFSARKAVFNKFKRKSKVYVTVQLSDRSVLYGRRRLITTDIAGKYICCFSSDNVKDDYVSAEVHQEGEKRTFRARINRSTYYARNGFESKICRFIHENPEITFVAPSYHKCVSFGRDSITDTQLYVSGSVEGCESHKNAAIREIREEIGLEVSSIVIVKTINGDTWFHATLG